MSDDDEGECKATAKERQHHAEQTPLVLHGKWQVLQKDKMMRQEIFYYIIPKQPFLSAHCSYKAVDLHIFVYTICCPAMNSLFYSLRINYQYYVQDSFFYLFITKNVMLE